MNYTHHEWAPARYNPPLIEWVEFALALSLIPFDSSLSFTHLVREDTLVSEQETPVCVCVCVCACVRGGVSDGGVQVWKPSPDKYSSYLIHGVWCVWM